MKRIICKCEYNTEKSTVLHRYTVGAFGDPDGYEEALCRTESGLFYIYGNGGATSPYPEEKITRIAKDRVDAWIAAHS